MRVQIAAQFVADKVIGLGGFASGSEGDRLWEGVRKIWLQNYSEKLARWAMGNEEAVLFLKRCLYFNSKIQVTTFHTVFFCYMLFLHCSDVECS